MYQIEDFHQVFCGQRKSASVTEEYFPRIAACLMHTLYIRLYFFQWDHSEFQVLEQITEFALIVYTAHHDWQLVCCTFHRGSAYLALIFHYEYLPFRL
jgi:hypothetical protein